jgi:hypothetical protein
MYRPFVMDRQDARNAEQNFADIVEGFLQA